MTTPTPGELPSISGAIEGARIGGTLGAPLGSAASAIASAAAGGAGFQVAADVLINAANKLQAQAGELSAATNHQGLKKVIPCGTDPVSGPAANAFKAAIDPMVLHTTTYVKNMNDGADMLRKQAKDYGATEDQITQSWTAFQQQAPAPNGPANNPPSSTPPIATSKPSNYNYGGPYPR
jgi:uncharacterized protein YukE